MTDEVRNDKGQFLPGKSGNPSGRPRNESAKLMRAAVEAALTPERAETIAKTLIDRAARGDWRAREQLFKLIGANEPEAFDFGELTGAGSPEDWAAKFEMVRQRLEEYQQRAANTGQ